MNLSVSIPTNPSEFDHAIVREGVLNEIHSIINGTHPRNHFCKCSHFSIAEIIEMSLNGGLFHGYGKGTPEELSEVITNWIYKETIRVEKIQKEKIKEHQ